MIKSLWKTERQFLKQLKLELSSDIAIPFLGLCAKELEAGSQRDICISVFTVALSTTVKRWKQPKSPSTKECMSKMWYIHTMEYYSALKRKFCNMLQHE